MHEIRLNWKDNNNLNNNFHKIWFPSEEWLPAKQFPKDDGEVDLGKVANSSMKLLDDSEEEEVKPIKLSRKGASENLVYIKENEITTNF